MRFSISSLDPLIAQRSILLHPFYQKWSRGELTMSDLRTYAKEYYWLVQRIPGIVASLRNRLGASPHALRLERNTQEELEHIALWERFSFSLGIAENELMNDVPSKTVKNAVRALEALVTEGLDEGVAAMYALERELPKVAATKKEGLLKFYGLSSPDAHAYFDEHLEEERHFDLWRQIPVDEDRATVAAEKCLVLQHQVLDGVCERAGILNTTYACSMF